MDFRTGPVLSGRPGDFAQLALGARVQLRDLAGRLLPRLHGRTAHQAPEARGGRRHPHVAHQTVSAAGQHPLHHAGRLHQHVRLRARQRVRAARRNAAAPVRLRGGRTGRGCLQAAVRVRQDHSPGDLQPQLPGGDGGPALLPGAT